MLAFIEGEPVASGHDYVIISAGGLGYRVYVPQSQVGAISARSHVRLYTHLVVRDDNLTLFGMLEETDLELFRHMLTVSGIGPRLALAVLSTWSGEQLRQIVSREDLKALTAVAGIGRKTAQRMLLELKDKISVSASVAPLPGMELAADAEAALVALGYRPAEIRPVVRSLAAEARSVEDLIRQSLLRLSGGGKR